MVKQYWTGLCTAAILLSTAGSVSASNLFSNPSFENSPNTPATLSGWTVGFSGSADANNLVMGVTGISGDGHGDGPQDGLEYAYFGNGLPIETFISQSLTTIPNEIYTITFWVAVNPFNNITEESGASFGFGTDLQVNFGSQSLDLGLTDSGLAWTQFSITGVAKSGTTLGQFTAWNDDAGMVFLDNIQTFDDGAAPEPTTFALAGGGLLLAGLWRKLKR